LVFLVLLFNLDYDGDDMDYSIRHRIAKDDLNYDEADALDSDRASDRNDEDRDDHLLDEMKGEHHEHQKDIA
jgi:hypothetical protein